MKPFDLCKPAAVAMALVAAAVLSGCGSSDNGHDGSTSTTPEPMIDAFFAAVSGIVSSSSDATEGNTIEAITATLPEDTEPVPLG